MYAVGRIGSYISRGVSNVSSPFHPFGGAVDIIVVKQPDGSFKTSPWYVQLGKFQGVLKAKERTLSINVNGVEADFHMYLDNRGEAYFVREVDEQEGPSGSNSSSLGCDTDGESNRGQIFVKTKSFNFLSEKGRSVSDPEVANKKMHKIFGLLVKSRSAKENGFRQSAHRMDRECSLERAEMAARLLEVKWSTNLDTKRSKKCDASGVLNLDLQDRGQSYAEEGDTLARKDCHHDEDQSLPSSSPKNYMDTFTLEETYLELKLVPDRSRPLNQPDGKQTNHAEVSKDIGTGKAQESSLMDSFVLHSLELKSNKNGFSCGEEQRDTLEIMEEAAKESGAERVHSYMCCETSGSFTEQVVLSSGGSSCKNVHFSCLTCKKLHGPFQSDCFPAAPRCNGDSTIAPCTMNRCIDSRDSNDCCDSLDGSREVMGENGSASAMELETITASSNVEHYLITEVDAIKEKKSSNQKISITDSSILEEHVGPDLHQKEGSSENHCPPLSSNTLSLGADNKDNEYYEVAFLEPKTTGIDASMIPEVEQFLMEGLYLSEHRKIELGESIGVDSTGKEVQIKGWSESSEIMADDTNDVVEGPEFVRGNSRQSDRNHLVVSQTLSIPSGTGTAYSDVDDRGQSAQSAPSVWSSENEMDVQGVNHFPSCSADSNSGMLMHSDIPSSLEEEAVKIQQSTSESARLEEDSKIAEEIKRILSEPAVELSLCGHLLSEGMGYEAASCAFHAEKLDKGKLTCIIGPDLIKDTRLIVRIGGLYFPWDAAVRIVSMIGSSEQIFEPEGMIAIDLTEKGSEGDPEKSSDPLRSKSKLGPFSTNKSNSMMDETESIPLGAGDSPDGMQKETDITQETMSSKKKVIKTKVPTSEQLASLNLKEGKNTVTFTFSTPMLGEQKVDARIFLWKWNARIVISDVDGTITKSDVLGQFMPLMGYDWSQTGVAHLFSAIKENGYELLFLSARAISQAYHTRQFLINLKQDGKALPEGPVCISPDGLFPSLFREMIRRAPHEFKIQCLEDIKALFPPGYNPFYAGFGNRITDEISYLKVGIPNGKIFIINPKGQVAVQRRVDTKSYSCLHNIVHDMFPPTSSTSGNEQEDYNSWNFWRLPPSDIL